MCTAKDEWRRTLTDPPAAPRGRPRGFTLIELLVVTFIVGILVTLVLAAVQAARSSAHRAHCLNNLKQIGIAIQAYQQSGGTYPPIGLGRRNPDGTEGYLCTFSPLARMLPQLEQSALFNAANFWVAPTLDGGLELNRTVMTTPLSLFVCPADDPSPVPGYGRANYRFSLGPTPSLGPMPPDASTYAGAFTLSMTYRPGDFADGLSNTIGASERLQGDWTAGAFKRGGDYLLPLQPFQGTMISADQAVAFCAGLNEADSIADSRGGETWFVSGYTFTLFNHCATPNSPIHDCSTDPFFNSFHDRALRDGVMSATSRHAGGVNCLWMDGSVRLVRDAVSLSVWRALGTRSGGEIHTGE